jgi:hypothetical protein
VLVAPNVPTRNFTYKWIMTFNKLYNFDGFFVLVDLNGHLAQLGYIIPLGNDVMGGQKILNEQIHRKITIIILQQQQSKKLSKIHPHMWC